MRTALQTIILVPALLNFAWMLQGCGSSGETKEESPPPKEDFSRYVREHESTFNPSDYGIEGWVSDAPPGQPAGTEEPIDPVTEVRPDTVPGFRVQVMITQEIDKASALRDSLLGAMPGRWIYIVYHPPYYKVRVGNYTDRFAADETLDRLRREGLTDAWVVPDRIIRNPPPAPLPADTTGQPVEPQPRN